jgi:ATP-dependent DNA ligase
MPSPAKVRAFAISCPATSRPQQQVPIVSSETVLPCPCFDLIELNGDDMRREPLEVRKATLASVLVKAAPGLKLNEHIVADGPTVFAHACKMGFEGIVAKRKNSPIAADNRRIG